MATPPPTTQSLGTDSTYTQMNPTDLETIGAHCAFCRQKDFLPFRCESCGLKFCLDHRTESSHYCTKKGAYLEARRQQNAKGTATLAYQRPTIYNHDKQCADPRCKSLIDTPLIQGVGCERCNRRYCHKHRLPEEHDCKNLAPIGARTSSARAETLNALNKLKAWGMQKKEKAATITSAVVISSTPSRLTPARRDGLIKTYMAELKRSAKGDAKIPVDKRLALQILGVPDSVSTPPSAWPAAKAFYSADWTAGRILDSAAKDLRVTNNNNRAVDEDQKIKVFHIDHMGTTGKTLDLSKALALQGVKVGDGLVLYKKWDTLPSSQILVERFGFDKWIK